MGMLEGRVAICAGAGRGVGAEVAKLMAAHGAKVVINDPGTSGSGEGSDQTPAQEIVDQIKAAGGEAAANYGSVAKFDDCLAMVQQARDTFGGLHIVFDAAGILRDKMFHNMFPEDWQAVIDVHLTGHFNINRAAINLFREQNYGRIIMVSSTSGLLGNIGQAITVRRSSGSSRWPASSRWRMRRRGITVNVICPSADTRMTRSVPTPKDPQAAALREERLRRSRADAIAPLCVFLASEQASQVNGQVFHQRAGELSLYGHMRPVRMVHRQGGWTPETLAEVAHPGARPAIHAARRRAGGASGPADGMTAPRPGKSSPGCSRRKAPAGYLLAARDHRRRHRLRVALPFHISPARHAASARCGHLLDSWAQTPRRGDFVANILFYMPLGFFVSLAGGRRALPAIALATLCGALLSSSMELAQYYVAERVTAAIDVYANVIGTALGATIGSFAGRSSSSGRCSARLPRTACPGCFSRLWLGYRLFPYVPTIDLHKYWDALKPVVLYPSLDRLRPFSPYRDLADDRRPDRGDWRHPAGMAACIHCSWPRCSPPGC